MVWKVWHPNILRLSPANPIIEGTPYHEPMEFESPQAHSLLGPLFTERALSDIPLFGSDRANVNALVENTMSPSVHAEETLTEAIGEPSLPDTFVKASSIAAKLEALRLTSTESSQTHVAASGVKVQANQQQGGVPSSQLQRHESLLSEIKAKGHPSPKAQIILDHIMLLRAKEGYLFNFEKNQKIVADDSWLRDVWAWVAGRPQTIPTVSEVSNVGIYLQARKKRHRMAA